MFPPFALLLCWKLTHSVLICPFKSIKKYLKTITNKLIIIRQLHFGHFTQWVHMFAGMYKPLGQVSRCVHVLFFHNIWRRKSATDMRSNFSSNSLQESSPMLLKTTFNCRFTKKSVRCQLRWSVTRCVVTVVYIWIYLHLVRRSGQNKIPNCSQIFFQPDVYVKFPSRNNQIYL